MNEVTIVGAGLSGSAAAIRLARHHREVLLLEREPGPADKVCGEFLSHEACAYLDDLGIDLQSLGAVPITHLRLLSSRGCPEIPLPFCAQSLSRRVLDEALIALAERVGAQVLRGVRVSTLRAVPGRWEVVADGDRTFPTKDLFLASGKHDLRSHRRPPGRQNNLVGFKMHFTLTAEQRTRLRGMIELIPFEHGYAGLSLVEEDIANFCLLVERDHLRGLDGGWSELVGRICEEVPVLGTRLSGAIPHFNNPLAVNGIPYGLVQSDSEGLWKLGDQAAVIPSFAGDGMAIALHTAAVACQAYLRGEGPAQYQARIAHELGPQVRWATTMSQALVRRQGRQLMCSAARLWPGLMGLLASSTRITGARLLVPTSR